jgi:hypothetical protein
MFGERLISFVYVRQSPPYQSNVCVKHFHRPNMQHMLLYCFNLDVLNILIEFAGERNKGVIGT